jgi:hypothetical protein
MADLRMPLHDGALDGGKRARIPENLVRDPDLAEVVQLARQTQELASLRLEAEACRKKPRRATDARDVASRLFVPKLRRKPKAVDRLFLRGA